MSILIFKNISAPERSKDVEYHFEKKKDRAFRNNKQQTLPIFQKKVMGARSWPIFGIFPIFALFWFKALYKSLRGWYGALAKLLYLILSKPNSRAFQNAKAGCNQISGCGIAAQNAKVLFCSNPVLGHFPHNRLI